MESAIAWDTDAGGMVTGSGLHDGYFYGALQEASRLTLYLKSYDDHERKIELSGITEMNITDFWIGSIIGDVHLWPLEKASPLMWEHLFAGRVALQDREEHLRKLIESASSRYFFALEASYGANVYALCDGMKISGTASDGSENRPLTAATTR